MRFIVTKDVTFEDFVRFCEIEKRCFSNEYINSPKTIQEIYNKNHDAFIFIRDNENGLIAGCVCLLPIKEKISESILSGKLIDSQIRADDVLKFEGPMNCRAHIYTLVVAKEYMNGILLLIMYKELKRKLRELEEKGIVYSIITADNIDIEGENISIELLGMKFAQNSSHGSKIFISDSKTMIEYCNRKEKRKNGKK